jgi:prepilin-type N-terminal cleavage/methylation domain-containing protein
LADTPARRKYKNYKYYYLKAFFMKKTNLTKGFTLIELLVVVAIIGILASVVLASLNTARTKGSDAAIKADLSGIRASAELQYDTNGGNYGSAISSGDDCGDGSPLVSTVFANPNITAATVHIRAQNGGVGLYCNQPANGSAYAIAVTLKSGTWWCIDSTGASKGTQGTTATGYTAQSGAATAALLDGTDYACN